MNQTLIVPLDGSPAAEQALPMATRLAHELGADVLLTHVIDPMATHLHYHEGKTWTIDDERGQMRSQTLNYLTYIKDTWCNTGVTLTTEVIEGDIGEAIVQLARQRQALYIVMTTHAKTGVARLLLGAVADHVMRQSPCPVLLVPPQTTVQKVQLAPLHHILVPLDGSLFAESALLNAKLLARQLNAKLHLFRVTVVVPTPILYPQAIPYPNALPEQIYELTEKYLLHVQTQLLLEGFDVDSYLGVGTPGDAILAHAEQIHADLIIMATHARTGLARTVLGSTTNHVIRTGKTPVLLVHPE